MACVPPSALVLQAFQANTTRSIANEHLIVRHWLDRAGDIGYSYLDETDETVSLNGAALSDQAGLLKCNIASFWHG